MRGRTKAYGVTIGVRMRGGVMESAGDLESPGRGEGKQYIISMIIHQIEDCANIFITHIISLEIGAELIRSKISEWAAYSSHWWSTPYTITRIEHTLGIHNSLAVIRRIALPLAFFSIQETNAISVSRTVREEIETYSLSNLSAGIFLVNCCLKKAIHSSMGMPQP